MAPVADGAEAVPAAPYVAVLDLHEGIAADVGAGCPRWPPELRLLSTLGKLVPGRCRATNLCDYCARLAAVETAEVLALDAVENEAPRTWSVLTTRTPTLDVAAFRRSREAVMRAVRRRWPDAEAATLVEFTTGYGDRAGGERRPHWNDLWKRVPPEDVDELRATLVAAWCDAGDSRRRRQRVDAEAAAQFAGAVSEFGGVMRYLALHFQKSDQAPPHGWRGHRFRATRGYLARPMAEARDAARWSLRFKRELRRARLVLGLDGLEAEEVAQRALYEAQETAWELVRVVRVPTAWGGDELPSAWADVPVPVRAA